MKKVKGPSSVKDDKKINGEFRDTAFPVKPTPVNVPKPPKK